MATVKDGNGLHVVDAAELDRLAGLEAERAEARAEACRGSRHGRRRGAGRGAARRGDRAAGHGAAGLLQRRRQVAEHGVSEVRRREGRARAGHGVQKGDVIRFEGYATVVAATPRDKRDKATGVVLECELQLQAEIDDLRLVSD